MPLPHPDADRPHPDAMTRQEIADALGVTYQTVYYWTAPSTPARRTHQVVRPSYGESTRKGDPAWFSTGDVEQLRELLEVIARYRELTGGGS